MAEALRIHWFDLTKELTVDSGRLPPGSPIKLRSEHHLTTPRGYEVFELVPKILHKWRGYKRLPDARWQSTASPDNASERTPSVYWSEEWALPGADEQDREARFQPNVLLETQEQVWRPYIRSAPLFIDKRQTRRGGAGRISPSVQGVNLGEASANAAKTDSWVARPPTDPRVAVELLQGAPLLDYLDRLASSFGDASEVEMPFIDALGSSATTYFGGDSIPENGDSSTERSLDADEPLWISVGIPYEQNLRAAYALTVHNLDEDKRVTTDPVFITAVRGHVISTDLPVELVSDDAREVLESLADCNFDPTALARNRGLPLLEVWSSLVAATRELGASTVEEAATLAHVASLGLLREPVPA